MQSHFKDQSNRVRPGSMNIIQIECGVWAVRSRTKKKKATNIGNAYLHIHLHNIDNLT